MRASRHFAIAVLVAAGVVAVPLTALAGDRGPSKVERATDTSRYTSNMGADRVLGAEGAYWTTSGRRQGVLQLRLGVLGRDRDPGHLRRVPPCRHRRYATTPRRSSTGRTARARRTPSATRATSSPGARAGSPGRRLIIRSWNSPTPAPRENFNSPTVPRDPSQRSASPDAAGRLLR